jgi:hypothetical protein
MAGKGRMSRATIWATTRATAAALCAAAAALVALSAEPAEAQSNFRYDVEYPRLGYSLTATDNPITRLQARLESGELQLEYRPGRGYLDSLLEALDVDPSSQVLVFSKTSLQLDKIDATKPRAVYFNDKVYVGFVQDSNIVELATIDPAIGTVFYVLNNRPDRGDVERENNRCLNCHDTQGMMGGGVPLLMVRSTLVASDGVSPIDKFAMSTMDDTPLRDRWGGWYVSGLSGSQVHLGNLLVPDKNDLSSIETARRGNLETLEGAGLFDTQPYLTPRSDIVALMVLEHQIGVQNQIGYVRFKAESVLERMGHPDAVGARTWDELPDDSQIVLTRMLDELVQRLLMVGAIELEEPIQGTAGFEAWFEGQGLRDEQGRSLHDLDLQSRLFAHRLSYLIYSEQFDGLPAFAKDYVYRKIAGVLGGSDRSEVYGHISDEERAFLHDLLVETKPDFAPYAGEVGG